MRVTNEPWIRVNKVGNIEACLLIPDELITPDLIPITSLEHKFLKRYGLDLEPVKHARFARSIRKKIRQYLEVDK